MFIIPNVLGLLVGELSVYEHFLEWKHLTF